MLLSKLANKKIIVLYEYILSNKQHGFRKGRSTVTNLCIFKQSIIDSFNDKAQFDVIYTDFEKAFDSVKYSLLISKLKSYDFSDPLLLWFNSFLTNRIQAEKYENHVYNIIIKDRIFVHYSYDYL